MKSLICEDCLCYVRNPRERFFSSVRKCFLYAKVLREWDVITYYNYIVYILLKGCCPGVRQEKGIGKLCCLVVVQFPSQCFWTVTLPFIGSVEFPRVRLRSLTTSSHLPLLLSNDVFSRLKKQTPNAASQFPRVRLCRSPSKKAPGGCLSFDVLPADSWGLWIRDICVKVPPKFCEGARGSQSASWRCLKGVVQQTLQKNVVSKNPSWEEIPWS